MSESKETTVEAPSLEECRKKAAAQLGLPPERVRLKVLQAGKKGLFGDRPFRVRAFERNNSASAKTDGGSSSGKIQSRIDVVLDELDKLDILHDEDGLFEEVLSSYEDLDEERRKEIREVAELLSDATGAKVKERISKDGRFFIHVSDDKLSATLNVKPPECMGAAVTLHQVLSRLREIGVIQGVNHVRIRELLELVLEKNRPIEDAVVAQGIPAVNGEDGAVEFFVEPTQKSDIVQEGDKADYRGKANIAVVTKGQRLARLVAPTSGTDGVTVCGEVLKAQPGSPAELLAGMNVNFNHDTQEYSSAIDGVMEVSGGEIRVHPTYIVRGDVDMSTGNIDFVGDVLVAGSVHDRFSVRATGSIEIRGSVEGCEIISHQGSVTIGKGIAGHHRCIVSAAKDVKASYIENACVYAGGSVLIQRSILHSEIAAGAAVHVTQGKGSIMGGITRAGELVHAKRLGAPSEPLTTVVVGINMEQHGQLRDMDRRLVALKNAGEQLDEAVKAKEHSTRNPASMSRQERQTLADLKKRLVVLHHQIDKMQKEREVFLESITAETRGHVKVSSEVFGRVRIQIGSLTDNIKTHMSSATFRADTEEGRIAQDPYRA